MALSPARGTLRLIRDVRPPKGRAGALRFLAKRWAHYSEYLLAERLLRRIPTVTLAELTDLGGATIAAQDLFGGQPGWSLGGLEQIALRLLIEGRGVTNVLELGTFDGGTTRLLAEAVGERGRVVTVDLPPEQVVFTPTGFGVEDFGREYRGTPVESRITSIRRNTHDLRPSDLGGPFDLILVDAAHTYDAGLNDTALAIGSAAPGALILFDDFAPHWGELVIGIVDACHGLPLRRLGSTWLGVLEVAR